jgi:hypothetical protein
MPLYTHRSRTQPHHGYVTVGKSRPGSQKHKYKFSNASSEAAARARAQRQNAAIHIHKKAMGKI